MKTTRRTDNLRTHLTALALLALFLSSCAPTALYSIDMRYVPVKPITVRDRPCGDRLVTVAVLRDARRSGDPLRIGTVMEAGGDRTPVLPEKVTAAEAVSSGIQSFLLRSGCSVTGLSPAWDLREESIDPAWGDILVGGTIDILDVTCDRSDRLSPVNRYQAAIKLTIWMADVRSRKIVHKTVVESSSSLKDVGFSGKTLQSQLNGVLSDAVERILDRSQKLYPGIS